MKRIKSIGSEALRSGGSRRSIYDGLMASEDPLIAIAY